MSSREMDQLRAEVDQLRKEVKIKDNEISSLVEENEDLKDSLKILDEAKAESKDGKTISVDKKMEVEITLRDKEIRDLKDKMGVLRKEKIQIQQQLEAEVRRNSKSAAPIIEIKEDEIPLQDALKDLQTKLNKQRLIITRLKQENIEKTSQVEAELKKRIKGDQDQEIVDLKAELEKLQKSLDKKKAKINELKSKSKPSKVKKKEPKPKAPTAPEAAPSDQLNLLIKDLQDKLNQSRATIQRLKSKLKESVGGAKEEGDLQEKIFSLQTELEFKEKQLADLQAEKQNLGDQLKSVDTSKFDNMIAEKNVKIENLSKQIELDRRKTTDLETKLNAKIQEANELQMNCDGLLKDNSALQTKYDELKAQLGARESDVHEGVEDQQQTIRIQELRSMLESFKKQIQQQRIEITTLRKK